MISLHVSLYFIIQCISSTRLNW